MPYRCSRRLQLRHTVILVSLVVGIATLFGMFVYMCLNINDTPEWSLFVYCGAVVVLFFALLYKPNVDRRRDNRN